MDDSPDLGPDGGQSAGGPPGDQPREGGDGPWAWRLTFEYDDSGVRIVERERVAMLAPPDDSELTYGARGGYWVELRDESGHGLYRQVLHDPFWTELEVHSPDPNSRPAMVEPESHEGIFEAVVPDLAEAHDVVLHGRASTRESAEGPAVPLLTDGLRAAFDEGTG